MLDPFGVRLRSFDRDAQCEQDIHNEPMTGSTRSASCAPVRSETLRDRAVAVASPSRFSREIVLMAVA